MLRGIVCALAASAAAEPHRIPLKKVATARHELKKNPVKVPYQAVEGDLGSAPVVVKNFEDAQYFIEACHSRRTRMPAGRRRPTHGRTSVHIGLCRSSACSGTGRAPPPLRGRSRTTEL